jgi:hypothetical protein
MSGLDSLSGLVSEQNLKEQGTMEKKQRFSIHTPEFDGVKNAADAAAIS